jgi:phage I-like protein
MIGPASPAAGWIDHRTGLRRKGKYGIEADVQWTDVGREFVQSRQGRYISPVLEVPGMFEFLYDEGPVPQVTGIIAASVVNIPALRMPSLNSRRFGGGRLAMDEKTKHILCTALGLPLDAKDETILAAVQAKGDELSRLTARLAELDHEDPPPTLEPEPRPAAVEGIDLTQWVPRQEFDAISKRLVSLESDRHSAKIDESIRRNKARIQSPAYEKVLREQLASGALSFDAFEKLMAATPESRLTTEDPKGDRNADSEALDLEPHELQFCEEQNVDPAKFAATKKRRMARRNMRVI